VIRRGALFTGWALLGTAASYGWLYLASPFGLAIAGAVAGVALLLRAAGRGDNLESIALAAGPGAFCLLVAASAESGAAVWAAVGAVIVMRTHGWKRKYFANPGG
jgi:hypothetical protein